MINYESVGIDVAKDKFDVCILKENGTSHKIFANTQVGFNKLVVWLNKSCKNLWICMEATGHYSELLADFLVNKGIKVSVVNPVQIKYFSRVKLSRNKNDKVDARIIAEYCQIMRPRIFVPRTDEQKYIRELIQLEDTVKIQRSQLQNQLSCSQSSAIKKSFNKVINALDKQLKKLSMEIQLHIEKNERWNNLVNLLTSIKGFGKLSAYRFLAYLPDIRLFKNAKQLAAFIGVSPKQKESGKYAGKTKLSKLGNPRLRNILYMPALSAKRFNEPLKGFVSRLENSGLAPKAILCAVMRKLVHIIFGMIKTNSFFNPKLV